MDCFRELDDPRIERSKRHQLLDIVAIAVCAVICGADSWVANSWVYVEMSGKSREEWFRSLRQISRNLLKRETSLRAGIQGKRLRAGWREDCLLKVLLA